jgi:hypothetical protein
MTVKRVPKEKEERLRCNAMPQQCSAAQTGGRGFSRAAFAGWIYVRELFSLNA